MGLEMPFSGKLQTETKPIPMKWQPEKPNTKPIFILPKNTNIKPKFKKIVLNMPIKYQENTKNFGTEVPNTDLILDFLGIPHFWLPIGTPGPYLAVTVSQSHSRPMPHTRPHITAVSGQIPVPPNRPTQARSGPVAVGHQHQSHWRSKVGGRRPTASPPPGSHVPVAQPHSRTMSNARPHITNYFEVGGGGGKRLPWSMVTPTQN